jgi:SAM-dependent methyltransferase
MARLSEVGNETKRLSLAQRCLAARCRSCSRIGLEPVVDFGEMPVSNDFVLAAAEAPEVRAPLALAICTGCGLAQLLETVPQEQLFGPDYSYLSSVSTTIVEAARANVDKLIARYRIGRNDQAVELACNDGYLLRHFTAHGIRVLGLEPAPLPAAAARKAGIDVIEAFFSRDLARKLVNRGLRPKLVIANNVVAHVSDPNDFVAGIATLLAVDGIAVVEVHSLADLVAQLQFDTIYHEHVSYFSATSIAALYGRHGLHLLDLERIPLQGGSLRLYFARAGRPSATVMTQWADETRTGIASGTALKGFAERTTVVIDRLRRLVLGFADDGCRIAAYGAAAKGTMLLNHLGLDEREIGYVVDRNPHKQGRCIPGVRIPIAGPERLVAEPPDVILLLPWNLRDEILSALEPLRLRGTRIIVPLPDVEVL